jgi:hypothetical protein
MIRAGIASPKPNAGLPETPDPSTIPVPDIGPDPASAKAAMLASRA